MVIWRLANGRVWKWTQGAAVWFVPSFARSRSLFTNAGGIPLGVTLLDLDRPLRNAIQYQQWIQWCVERSEMEEKKGNVRDARVHRRPLSQTVSFARSRPGTRLHILSLNVWGLYSVAKLTWTIAPPRLRVSIFPPSCNCLICEDINE
jgi:hypothetical protein